MKTKNENRQHLRVPLTLSVVITTPRGEVRGKTADISVSGLAILLFVESVEIEDTFQILLLSSESHQMTLTCEKVWVGKYVSDETLYNAIGVRFTEISPRDHETIATMVEEFYLV